MTRPAVSDHFPLALGTATNVSVLTAFPEQTRKPEFLDIVRRRAAGRPLPIEARPPGLRSLALDLVAALWAALLRDCRKAIEIREGVDGREVRFFGFLRYRVAPDRSSVHATRTRGPGEEAELVDVGSPLPTWLWVGEVLRRHYRLLEPVRDLLDARSTPRTGADGEMYLAGEVWNWALACIESLVRQQIDDRSLRRQLRAALDLDPALLSLARRARVNQALDVRSDWYTACGEYRVHLERVADKAPALLRALGWLIASGHLVRQWAPLALLKFFFKGLEATPQDWRRLLRDPARPVWRQYPRGPVEGAKGALELLVLWARLHRGIPVGQSLPSAMWEIILRTCRGGPDRCARALADWTMPPALIRAGLRRAQTMMATGRFPEFLHHEWARVVAWVADFRNEGVHAYYRSWNRALRAAADAERKVRAWARECDEYPWGSLVAEFEHAGLRARALVKASDLVEESIAMRHCADSFVLECSSGHLRLFRVEELATGKHLATISLARSRDLRADPDWRPDQVRRFANRTASPVEVCLAEALAAEYRRRELQPQQTAAPQTPPTRAP